MKTLQRFAGLRYRLILTGIGLIVISLTAASAGNPKAENGDGGPATQASINGPDGISIDEKGNLYIAEMEGRRVRKVDGKTGVINTVAGSDGECCSETGKLATSTTLFAPIATAVDAKGNVYITEISARIRRVDAATGIATIEISELTGDYADKPGVAPSLPTYEQVKGLAISPSGVLYITGSSHGKIYTLSGGVVSVFAGIGGHGFAGDGKSPAEAQFNWPMGIAFDPAGRLFIADFENCRIRKVEFGLVSTIAGNGICGSTGDGGQAIAAKVDHPTALAVDREGSVYFNAPAPNCVRRIDAKTSLIRSVPGTCETKAGTTEGPSGLAVDTEGNLYITLFGTNVVRRVDAKTGRVTTVAGNGLPERADALL